MFNMIDSVRKPIPTIGNLPSSYDESLSYLDMLMTWRKYLNNCIENVNAISEVLNSYDDKMNELMTKYNELEIEFQRLWSYFDDYKVQVNNMIDRKFQDLYNQTIQLINEFQIVFNGKIDELRAYTDSEIQRIELGDINCYNPTTGLFENINKVITDVYSILRQNAISVTEFEALDLTATDYDSLEISAYNFDVNGKTFLITE